MAALRGESLDQTRRATGFLDDLAERLVVGVGHDELDRFGAQIREDLVELFLRGAGRAVRGKVGLVDATELDARQRHDQQEQTDDDGDGDLERVTHHPAGEPAPDARLDLLGVLGLTETVEAEGVDALAEDAEDRGRIVIDVSAARPTVAMAP